MKKTNNLIQKLASDQNNSFSTKDTQAANEQFGRYWDPLVSLGLPPPPMVAARTHCGGCDGETAARPGRTCRS